MPTEITLRSEKGSTLTIQEVDANFSNLRTAVDTAVDNARTLNYGPDEPLENDREIPWFKTDSSYNPIGLYSWNGTEWVPIPTAMPSGSTRPESPANGDQFFDTTINVALIYERAAWRTLSGSPGDCKFVDAETESAALAKSPGWSILAAGAGRTLAGTSDSHAVNTTVGTETVSLTAEQNGPHTHNVGYISFSDGTESGNDLGLTPAGMANIGTRPTESSGTGAAHNNMQPTLFLFLLKKD